MKGFDTRVVTLDASDAERFDAGSGVATRRVRATRARPLVRAGLLNSAALLEARRFHPHAILSMHVVASPAAAVIRRALATRTVQVFHAKEIPDKRRLSAFAAARADAVIAVSSYTARLIAEAGASPACLRLIPPGVDLPSEVQSAGGGRPTILTIARMDDRYKGHDVMIDALARVRGRVPQVQWIVIGDGSLRAELEARVRSHGLADSVTFLGAVADEQRDQWLSRCDLLAMPSRLPGGGRAGEGFGMVYLEAAAHGKPVVAGNVAGAVDAVADGESGLLVDPTDAVAVADAILTLLGDRGLAERMGRAGAERARAFAWPVIAARVEALVLEQLASAPRRGERQAQSAPTK
jgi:phosphatidylinositol alpha-1,6-mannosyltransferase